MLSAMASRRWTWCCKGVTGWLAAEVTTRRASGPSAVAELPWEVLDQNRLTELGGLETTGNGPALVGELIERL
jgi:hypothetical protein